MFFAMLLPWFFHIGFKGAMSKAPLLPAPRARAMESKISTSRRRAEPWCATGFLGESWGSNRWYHVVLDESVCLPRGLTWGHQTSDITATIISVFEWFFLIKVSFTHVFHMFLLISEMEMTKKAPQGGHRMILQW